MSQEDWLFLVSEYLFNIHSFNILLERVMLRGYTKLSPTEVIDDRLGRSKNQFIQTIILSIFNEQSLSFLPRTAPPPNLMEFKCGRSIIYSFKSFILNIIVDNEAPNA